MSSWTRLALAGAVIVAAINLPAVVVADSADKAKEPVPADALKTGLMAALGDSFEYLGGEVGRTKARTGYWAAERFWFAKVRPKAAGAFAVTYTTEYDFPDDYKKKWRPPERGEYIIPIKVGERGAPRVVNPGGWGGSAYPHANVGDAILIPVLVDRSRRGHTFAVLDDKNRHVKAFFSVAGERNHEAIMNRAAEKPVVRNDAADWLDLLASWGSSITDRPGTTTHHGLSAYLQFKRPGEFNLAGRLAEPDEKAARFLTGSSPYIGPRGPLAEAREKAGDDGAALRVRPKDNPVTVVLEYMKCIEHSGKSTFQSSGAVPGGTVEIRVGDRVLVGCGGYSTPAKEKPRAYRQGVVVVRPFKPVEPYSPEPGK